MRRRKRRKQRKIIILTSIALLFVLTTGYAAFQTNLNITAKGNIIDKGIRPIELKNNLVTSGDGLYKDTTEDDKYIFKGANPNNYITFNSELWRIINLDENGNLKIIRNDALTKPWDEYNTRNSTTSTYCNNTTWPTCNAWAATTNLVGTPSVFTIYAPNGESAGATATFSGTVSADASLNTYLNNDYYNTLTEESQKAIEPHDFNVASPGNNSDTENIATNIKQEQVYKWKGKIGLMNVTDVLKTSPSDSCSTLQSGQCMNNSERTCKNNNWLIKYNEFTLSPYPNSDRYLVWNISAEGCIYTGSTESSFSSRTVIYLKSDIYLKGTGEENNPFTIKL